MTQLLRNRRTALLGLGGLGLLLPQRADANTPFTNFAFPATGSPTPRTMPARLAEIKNVKDFGAIGDGVADDTAAIQDTIDWTSGANRGTIFFPLGRYLVSASLNFNYDGNLSIAFVGVAGTLILASFNGYVFDRHLATPNNTTGCRVFEKLNIQNAGNTGGCIRIGSTNGAFIRDCEFGAHIDITTEDSAGNSSENILIENCSFVGTGTVSGSHGVIMGGGGAVMACDCRNVDTGYRIYGSGFHAAGNRTENTNTAFLIGLDSAGTNAGASGFSIISGTTEGNGIAFDLAGTCTGFAIGPYNIQGHDSGNSGDPIGVQNSQYGVRVQADMAQAGVFNVATSGHWDVAGFSFANASSRANNVVINTNSSVGGGAGVAWIMPTNAQTAEFINCNTDPLWTFSQLPSGGNVLEGDEFNISDANTTTWGANVTTGGGSSHVLVRWNGSNWTVVGK